MKILKIKDWLKQKNCELELDKQFKEMIAGYNIPPHQAAAIEVYWKSMAKNFGLTIN